ncbi:VanW family protein [Rarobacter faecitabidus]|uniref:Vancomycin resistance protein YoaR n=1 Tax=Rarobacter faecitabidus TaxID=13243 RepID=A0A542ZUI7_RARFA|nr:VanW family protein [Rarobacter faecitabidus]TQL64035.1 vancomycin resistance protein YoaR [Rarobacter faecitabidus]
MTNAAGADPQGPLDEFEQTAGRGISRRLRGWIIALTVLLVLVAVYVAAQAALASKIPNGTTVLGVAIGGKTADEASALLETQLAARVAEPIGLTAGDHSVELDPSAAGLSVDYPATTDGLTGFSLSPARLISHLAGGKAIDPVVVIDNAKLEAAVAGLAPALASEPVNGSVTIVDGSPVASPASDGTALDSNATADLIADKWPAEAGPYVAPISATEPVIGQSAVDAAMAQASTIVSAPVWVVIGDQRAELPENVVASALTYSPSGAELVPALDAKTIRGAVLDRTTNLETKAEDAYFAFTKKNKPKIKGGQAGTALDGQTAADAVLAAAQTTDRTASVALVESEPKVTKASLEALGVKEVVSEFSTPLTSEPIRTSNIANAGRLLTGTLVAPGETFSLEKTIGPVDAEHGYREAGVIVNGFHTTGMGGGLSQVATTTYNAGFFAGMVDIEHRPHTEWLSRYPEGRESTIYTGSIDVKFRNDSPYGLLLRGWVEGGRFHVEAWSTKYYKVDTTTSGRSNVVAPKTVYSTAQNCEPSGAGNSGFTVSVSRTVTEIESGKTIIDETKTWTYRPTNAIICGKKPSANDKKSE